MYRLPWICLQTIPTDKLMWQAENLLSLPIWRRVPPPGALWVWMDHLSSGFISAGPWALFHFSPRKLHLSKFYNLAQPFFPLQLTQRPSEHHDSDFGAVCRLRAVGSAAQRRGREDPLHGESLLCGDRWDPLGLRTQWKKLDQRQNHRGRRVSYESRFF